jgi:glucan phosphoethanolaminetransferase (alkaline phosphatase superfamily)
MTSGFYYTTGSVPLVLTRKPVDCETRFYDEKSIISAFREAGYATWSISYTKKTQPEDDAMNLIFLEADQYINHTETSGTFDDIGMLPYIKKILADDSKNKKLIVIKMIGAHYLYEERYPKDFELYKPSYKSVYNQGEAANDLTLLKNSYKNAVAYSANFIDQLAGLVYQYPEPALMSFISDHGTSLAEDPGGGKYVGRAKGAYHIAFFITGNQLFWDNTSQQTKENLLKRRHAALTQEYFLETYLSLSGIKYFDPRPRFNIAGNGFEAAQNRLVWTGVGLEDYSYLADEQSIEPPKK